jgi:hypothetical protein
VITGLTELVDPRVHEIFEVISSSCYDVTRFAPKFVVDVASNNVFVSNNQPDQWIGYHFKENVKLRLCCYVLRSRFDGWMNANNLKDWVIEISLDEIEWKIVDRRMENYDLNGTNAIKMFKLADVIICQYMRLRQMGLSHAGKNFLVLSGFELFEDFVD